MPKGKVRLVTTIGQELALALRAAVEEAGISEAMLLRMALSEYLEVEMTPQDQQAVHPRRQTRPVSREAIDQAKRDKRTRRDRETNDLLVRLRKEKGLPTNG